MTVIGIDPSLSCTGIAILDQQATFSTIVSSNKLPLLFRIIEIGNRVDELIASLPEDAVFAIESPSFQSKGNSLPKLTALFYYLCATVVKRDRRLFTYAPAEVKKVAGNGGMQKLEMFEALPSGIKTMIMQSCAYKHRLDVSDAYWVAQTWIAKNLR